MADFIMTPEFRVSFPNVFRPREAQDGGKAKYSLSMLFAKGVDLSAFKAAAQAAAAEKWGAKVPGNLKSPFLDAGRYEYEGYEEGMVLIRATSLQKPGLVDMAVQPIIDEADFYPGCYARAKIRAFAYDNNGNRGISFGLGNIQKLRDGEPLGGRSRPEDDFDAVSDGGEAVSAGSLF